jgi:hypothetical protein
LVIPAKAKEKLKNTATNPCNQSESQVKIDNMSLMSKSSKADLPWKFELREQTHLLFWYIYMGGQAIKIVL